MPNELVLVIDHSGSLVGRALRRAKDCVAFLIGRMQPEDRIAVIGCASTPTLLAPLTTPSAALLDVIEPLVAGGRTDLGAAMELAASVLNEAGVGRGLRRIVLLTDGSPSAGLCAQDELVQLARRIEQEQGARTVVITLISGEGWGIELLKGPLRVREPWRGWDATVPLAKELRDVLQAAPRAEMTSALQERRSAWQANMAERDRLVLAWCDASPTNCLVVTGARGDVARIGIEAAHVPAEKQERENARRLALVGVARMAAFIEEADSGASAWIRREGVPGTMDELRGLDLRALDWRLRLPLDYGRSPFPPKVKRWWRARAGMVTVTCECHGELASFDVSVAPHLLAAAWDVAVVEYQMRTDDADWDDPGPDGEGSCDVTAAAARRPGEDLLSVAGFTLKLEGPESGLPWWQHEIVS